LELKTYVAAGKAVDTEDVRTQQYIDIFVPEKLQNRLANIGIFTGRKLQVARNQGYAASQSAQSLAELKADVAASDDDQVLGLPLQVERFDMRHRPGFPQTWGVGYGCMGSDVHEHAVSGERTFARIAQSDVNRVGRDECAIAEDELISGRAIFFQMNPDYVVDHGLFARVYANHVDSDWSGPDPEFPTPSHERGDLR
jgi:hypothetical protein